MRVRRSLYQNTHGTAVKCHEVSATAFNLNTKNKVCALPGRSVNNMTMSGACRTTGAASVSQSAQPYFWQRRDEVPGNALHPGQGNGLPCSSWTGNLPGSDADGNERMSAQSSSSSASLSSLTSQVRDPARGKGGRGRGRGEKPVQSLRITAGLWGTTWHIGEPSGCWK